MGDTITVQNPVSFRMITATVTGARHGACVLGCAPALRGAHTSPPQTIEGAIHVPLSAQGLARRHRHQCAVGLHGHRSRLANIGDPPVLASIGDPNSPVNAGAPALPIPPPPEPTRAVNSLWASGSRSFFHDPRASRPATSSR